MTEPSEQPGMPRPVASAVRARASELFRFHRREVIAIAVLAALVVAGALVAYARARPVPAAAMAPVEPTMSEKLSTKQIFVHVVGAVNKPGVYPFDDGARVFDAVKAAGGFTKDADKQAINLARVLVDGEQVVVPRKGDPQTQGAARPPGAPGASGGKININSAGVAEFDSLPGIGPVLAQRIIDYRTQHGPFHSVKDLQKVSGIGPRKFASIEPLLTV